MNNDAYEKYKRDHIFDKLNSVQDLRDWCYVYLDLDLPMGHVHPDSNSSPAEALWSIYELIKTGKNEDVSQVVMVSSRDSYKCSRKGTKILKKNGLANIEDVKLGDVIWSGWGWRKVTDWIDDGTKESIEFKLTNGVEVCGSPIHRYWCLRNGKTQWIKSQDILPSDLFCVNTNTGFNRKLLLTNTKEYDVGYILGLLTGDGSLTLIDSGRVGFTNSDKKVIEKYKEICKRLLNVDPKPKDLADIYVKSEGIFRKPKSQELYFSDKTQAEYLKSLGLTSAKAHEKEIPSYCYQSNSAMLGFIAGIFDSDGTYNSKNQIEIPITATKLLKDLQKVFISYGIDARIYENKKLYTYEKTGGSKQNHIVHKLYINSNEYPKFQELGLIFLADKASSINKAKIYDAHDTIPFEHVQDFLNHTRQFSVKRRIKERKNLKPKIGHSRNLNDKPYKGITYGKLNELYQWFLETRDFGYMLDKESDEFVFKIKEILSNKWFPYKQKVVSKSHFYDLTVEGDHSYWSNGLISHNTLSASVLQVILLVHYRLSLAVMSAQKGQSEKSISYINSHFRKISKYLESYGWKNISESKSRIEWIDDNGDNMYIRVVVATRAGSNSEHLPVLCIDEIDLIADPQALEEAKMIPSTYRGISPITIGLSTLKYAGGLMDKFITDTKKMGGHVYKWNIIDVTEKIPEDQLKRDEPKQIRYIGIELPMRSLKENEWENLPRERQSDFKKIEVYAGIADHPMLPVMENFLADRPESNIGGLYKTLKAVHNNFKGVSDDMASAQLLCRKPSSKGLVYSRYIPEQNSLTLEEAWYKITGEKLENVELSDFAALVRNLGLNVEAGVDWGYTNEFAVVVGITLPNQTLMLVDVFAAPGQELDDCVKICLELKDKWNISRFWCDPAYPAYVKTFNGKGLLSPKFTKDVARGIEAVRGRIVDSSNTRRFFVVKTINTERLSEGLGTYHWKLNAQGNPTTTPDHTEESDIMDALRYLCENLFGHKNKKPTLLMGDAPKKIDNAKPLLHKVKELATNEQKPSTNKVGPKMIW